MWIAAGTERAVVLVRFMMCCQKGEDSFREASTPAEITRGSLFPQIASRSRNVPRPAANDGNGGGDIVLVEEYRGSNRWGRGAGAVHLNGQGR